MIRSKTAKKEISGRRQRRNRKKKRRWGNTCIRKEIGKNSEEDIYRRGGHKEETGYRSPQERWKCLRRRQRRNIIVKSTREIDRLRLRRETVKK